jgi:hypothetical protein
MFWKLALFDIILFILIEISVQRRQAALPFLIADYADYTELITQGRKQKTELRRPQA